MGAVAKHRRARLVTSITVVVALLLAAVSMSYATAAAGDAKIDVSVHGGAVAVVLGTNYPPSASVDVTVTAGEQMKQITSQSDASGRFVANTFLPPNFSGQVDAVATSGDVSQTGTANASGGASSIPVADPTETEQTGGTDPAEGEMPAPQDPASTDPGAGEDPGTVTEQGTTSGEAQPFPAKAVGMYYMLWGGKGGIKAVPKEVNVVYLAFAQGDPPTLVGYGDEGEGGWAAAIKEARARGVRVIVSIGGSGGAANVGNRDAFVNGIMAINEKAPIDGLDWDLEGPAMTADDVVYICTTLKEKLGKNFAITMAPNGSNVDEYIEVAVALQKADALDMIGQQFYDAPVSVDAASGRISQMISAGIPEEKVAIGMMNGDGGNYWSVETCVQNVTTLKQKYPNLRGGYLWESGRDGAAEWASQVGALLMQ